MTKTYIYTHSVRGNPDWPGLSPYPLVSPISRLGSPQWQLAQEALALPCLAWPCVLDQAYQFLQGQKGFSRFPRGWLCRGCLAPQRGHREQPLLTSRTHTPPALQLQPWPSETCHRNPAITAPP